MFEQLGLSGRPAAEPGRRVAPRLGKPG